MHIENKKKFKKGIVGFSQKAFIFDKAGKFLALRRTKTAPSNPLKWDLPGGDVDFGEDPSKSMKREIKEESGFIVRGLVPFDVEAHINPRGNYWVTIAWKANISRGTLLISWEHDLHKWVTADEFLRLRMAKKLRKFGKILKQLDS